MLLDLGVDGGAGVGGASGSMDAFGGGGGGGGRGRGRGRDEERIGRSLGRGVARSGSSAGAGGIPMPMRGGGPSRARGLLEVDGGSGLGVMGRIGEGSRDGGGGGGGEYVVLVDERYVSLFVYSFAFSLPSLVNFPSRHTDIPHLTSPTAPLPPPHLPTYFHEHSWTCTLKGPKPPHSTYRVEIEYSAFPALASVPDPQRPVGMKRAIRTAGLMTILERVG